MLGVGAGAVGAAQRRQREGEQDRVADHRLEVDATGVSGGKRQHQHSEEVEPVLDARRRAAEREDEGATEIEHHE